MSVKKLLLLSAASLVAMGATAAMAGGPDHMAMPSEPAFQNSVYVEGHVGYVVSKWSTFNSNDVIGNSATSLFSPTSSKNHGWTGGADLGYNITQNIAVEGGWFYLPKVEGSTTGHAVHSSAVATGTATVKSWFAYTAAKFSVPFVVDGLDLFGKLGVAYRSLKYSTSVTSTDSVLLNVIGNGHYWAPVFGAGIQYNWGSWLVGAQYMYLPGNSSVNNNNTNFGAPNAAPEVHMGTAFLGYKFEV